MIDAPAACRGILIKGSRRDHHIAIVQCISPLFENAQISGISGKNRWSLLVLGPLVYLPGCTDECISMPMASCAYKGGKRIKGIK